jgi:hypothetical protein
MGEGVTLDKDAYVSIIQEDIALVEKYIPKEHIMRAHIITVLKWSIDKAYPPEYWDIKKPITSRGWDICPDCEGNGYADFIDNEGVTHPCQKCYGTGYLPPKPPEPRILKEGEEPPAPPKIDNSKVINLHPIIVREGSEKCNQKIVTSPKPEIQPAPQKKEK